MADNKDENSLKNKDNDELSWRVPVLVTFLIVASILIIAIIGCTYRLVRQYYGEDNDGDDSSSDDDSSSSSSGSSSSDNDEDELKKDNAEGRLVGDKEVEGGSATDIEDIESFKDLIYLIRSFLLKQSSILYDYLYITSFRHHFNYFKNFMKNRCNLFNYFIQR